MKPFAAALFCLFIVSGCATKVDNNDLAREGLKGSVKSMREFTYREVSDRPDTNKVKRETDRLLLFDKEGYLTDYLTFQSDKSINSRIATHRYGSYSVDSLYDAGENLLTVTKHEYDGDGDVTRMSNYNIYNQPTYNESYTYNDKKELTETIAYTGDSRLIERKTYVYDSLGRKSEQKEYVSTGKMQGYEIYEYDKEGKKIASHYYASDGKLMNIDSFGYDSHGSEIKSITHNVERDTTIVGISVYEYDANGNWINRIFSKATVPKLVVKRELVYY